MYTYLPARISSLLANQDVQLLVLGQLYHCDGSGSFRNSHSVGAFAAPGSSCDYTGIQNGRLFNKQYVWSYYRTAHEQQVVTLICFYLCFTTIFRSTYTSTENRIGLESENNRVRKSRVNGDRGLTDIFKSYTPSDLGKVFLKIAF